MISAGWLLVAAFFLAGTVSANGTYTAQLLAIGLIIAFSLIIATRKGRNSHQEEQTTLFWILAVLGPLISAITSIYYNNIQFVFYSVLLSLTLFAAREVATRYEFERVTQHYTLALILLAAVLLITDYNSVLFALSGTQTETGLFRLSPFGNHPNLAAHFFGSGAVLAIARLLRIDQKPRLKEDAVLALLFLALVLASRSRGSLLAIAISTITLIFITKPQKNITADSTTVKIHRWTLLVVFGLTLGAVLISFKIDYFSEMLDLDSKYRGLGSGGSGRLENWSDFVALMMTNPELLFFGHGFRSWSIKEIGFDSDNSYITLAYEIGFPLALAITMLSAKTLVLSIIRYERSKMSPEAIAILVFLLTESIFARYFISIGNPASFISLVALISVTSAHSNMSKQHA